MRRETGPETGSAMLSLSPSPIDSADRTGRGEEERVVVGGVRGARSLFLFPLVVVTSLLLLLFFRIFNNFERRAGKSGDGGVSCEAELLLPLPPARRLQKEKTRQRTRLTLASCSACPAIRRLLLSRNPSALTHLAGCI